MGYIIKRSDMKKIADEHHWILLYGRRKVGKTFLLRDLCNFENYYSIKTDGSVISPKGTLSIAEMLQEVKTLLSQNKTAVIDEFQRLQQSILEEIMPLHPHGRLILSGSSLRIIHKIFEPQSPLLGFFTPIRIGFIRPSDIMQELHAQIDDAALIELAAFLREPWIIPMYNKEKTVQFMYNLIANAKYTMAALIGEIFTDEDRSLTKKYEALLHLIGSGIWKTKELTTLLYARKLIPDPSPTHIIQYLKNLEEMELIESIKLHKAKGKYYRLASPLMNIYFYLESRYDISSRESSLEELRPTLERLMNMEIQNFIADLFAELYDGRKEYYISAEKEVDFIITKRNKAEIIGEVKWKKITMQDIRQFKINASGLAGKKVIIGKQSEAEDTQVEVLQPKDLMLLVKKLKSR